jgi:glycosyltransferase involved in cell wall biosynthesis
MSIPSIAVRASVVIPCWNQLEFTRKCLAALFRRTGPSWELIVVNNGSTDGTADYLAGVQDVSPVPVTVIANSTNRGFPAAINQGLQYARGEYLVLLNNDVVVTEGWLQQLIALASIRVTTERHERDREWAEVGTEGNQKEQKLILLTTEGTEDTEKSGMKVGELGRVAGNHSTNGESVGRILFNSVNAFNDGKLGDHHELRENARCWPYCSTGRQIRSRFRPSTSLGTLKLINSPTGHPESLRYDRSCAWWIGANSSTAFSSTITTFSTSTSIR